MAEQACYFSAPDQALSGPIFGVWHRGAQGAQLGVVLCSAFGCEELSSHASLRELAKQLAQDGYPVLCFDYPGTGDSSDPLEPGKPLEVSAANWLPAWLQSVHLAIDELKRLSGVQQVVLAGLRIGATLALQTSSARADVLGVACVAPVVSGRQYIRELRALQLASVGAGEQVAATQAKAWFESGGFAMPGATSDALRELDLRQMRHAPAPHLLVLERDDMPSQSAWLADLAALDVNLAHQRLPGYPQLMLDPHRVEWPTAMWRAIRAWVQDLPTEPMAAMALHQTGTKLCTEAVLDEGTVGLTEYALTLNVMGCQIAAIVSRPLAQPAGADVSGHGMLIFNAGATRRTGPGRVYVQLARNWAKAGHVVWRIDMPGLGDSEPLPGEPANVVYAPNALHVVKLIMEEMRRLESVRQLHLTGLCAGAYHALKAVTHGGLANSAIIINPLTYFWHEGLSLDAPLPAPKVIRSVERYKAGLFRFEKWRKLVKGQIHVGGVLAVLSKWAGTTMKNLGREMARFLRIPMQRDLARELQAAVNQGTRLHFVFAQDEPGYPMLLSEGGRKVKALLARQDIYIHQIDQSDHVFARLGARTELLALLQDLPMFR